MSAVGATATSDQLRASSSQAGGSKLMAFSSSERGLGGRRRPHLRGSGCSCGHTAGDRGRISDLTGRFILLSSGRGGPSVLWYHDGAAQSGRCLDLYWRLPADCPAGALGSRTERLGPCSAHCSSRCPAGRSDPVSAGSGRTRGKEDGSDRPRGVRRVSRCVRPSRRTGEPGGGSGAGCGRAPAGCR